MQFIINSLIIIIIRSKSYNIILISFNILHKKSRIWLMIASATLQDTTLICSETYL